MGYFNTTYYNSLMHADVKRNLNGTSIYLKKKVQTTKQIIHLLITMITIYIIRKNGKITKIQKLQIMRGTINLVLKKGISILMLLHLMLLKVSMAMVRQEKMLLATITK